MIGELSNHLWQSTVFAILAGLLTLAFRKNRAQVRYWLWFSASLKFLLPFSLLLTLGGYLGRSRPTRSVPVPAITYTVVQVAEPFPEAVPPAPSTRSHADWIPIAVVSLWACGLAGIALMRLWGWLRIRAAVRSSTPMDIQFPVAVRSSSALLEPGVVGFFRPILLLPAGIVERLTPSQLQAVLAHERCHIERRDNLTAAIHMIVEAVFWFHPLVWWISARLVEERERACDEGVLELGSDPRVYAESILKTCEYCVESPIACTSGVLGSDLKKRIVRIMTQSLACKLGLRSKVVLGGAGLTTLVVPLVIGLICAPLLRSQSSQHTAGTLPSFEVATVKALPPHSLDKVNAEIRATGKMPKFVNIDGAQASFTYVSLKSLIALAYGLKPYQVTAPAWLDKDDRQDKLFDVVGKIPNGASKSDVPKMLQSLLEERFKLAAHWGTEERPVLALIIGKDGPKLKESTEALVPVDENAPLKPNQVRGDTPDGTVLTTMNRDGTLVQNMGTRGTITQGFHADTRTGTLDCTGVTMDVLASRLTGIFQSRGENHVVVDMTGLKGHYDFSVVIDLPRLAPTQPADANASPASLALEPSGASSLNSSLKQLGLKLEPSKAPVPQLIIDHLARNPTED